MLSQSFLGKDFRADRTPDDTLIYPDVDSEAARLERPGLHQILSYRDGKAPSPTTSSASGAQTVDYQTYPASVVPQPSPLWAGRLAGSNSESPDLYIRTSQRKVRS